MAAEPLSMLAFEIKHVHPNMVTFYFLLTDSKVCMEESGLNL